MADNTVVRPPKKRRRKKGELIYKRPPWTLLEEASKQSLAKNIRLGKDVYITQISF